MTYPVFGYQITLDDVVEFTAEINGVSDDLTVAAGTYWAWANGSGDLGTLHDAFADALAQHGEWSATPTVSTSYSVNADGSPSWRCTFSGGIASGPFTYEGSDSTKFDNALGLTQGAGGSQSLGVLGYLDAQIRWDGVWAPNVRGERIEPVYLDMGSQTISPYDASAHDRVRLGRRLLWFCDLPYVEAADISREIDALSSGYAALAGRSAGDDRGTLDDLLGAAGSDSEIRLVLGTATSDVHQCVLDAAQNIQRDAFTTEETVGGRRYRVALPLIQASTYTGVDT